MANFTELDRYLFGQATHYDIYRKLLILSGSAVYGRPANEGDRCSD